MPPKPKFTREEIIAAALDLVSEKGIQALTAKNIGDRLGISTRPIFTAFKNMEEVQQEVRKAAGNRFKGYTDKAKECTPAFKQMGIQMVLFAKEEPRLFELLFMKNDAAPHRLDEGYLSKDEVAFSAVETIQKDYDLTYEDARTLFHYVWIFTFGVGALCAAGVCTFSEEEISELLGQNFMAMLARVKTGAIRQPTVRPTVSEQSVGRT